MEMANAVTGRTSVTYLDWNSLQVVLKNNDIMAIVLKKPINIIGKGIIMNLGLMSAARLDKIKKIEESLNRYANARKTKVFLK
jgi:hypothetical protein